MTTEPGINDTLNDREQTYGDFATLATASQALKSVFRASPSYTSMTAVQREAMEMCIVKMCRIWYGNPMHFDSWRDMAGYATLAVEEFSPRADGRSMVAAALPANPVELLKTLAQAAE